MTSIETKNKFKIWSMINCYKDYKNLWCSCETNCWKYKGLSSRFVEAHMKDLIKDNKVKGIITIPYPRDINDFYGFNNGIMKEHPEWKERLPEMIKYGKNWQTFIKNYVECKRLINEKKYYAINKTLSNCNSLTNKLLVHEMEETEYIKLKEYVIMCSVNPNEMYDETDLGHTAIMCKFPKLPVFTNSYDKEGKIRSSITVNLFHPDYYDNIYNDLDIKSNMDKESEICDNFNKDSSRIEYNNKMRVLYERYLDGEIINDEEVPVLEIKEKEYDINYILDYKEKINEKMIEIKSLIDILNSIDKESITIEFVKNIDVYNNEKIIYERYLELFIKITEIKNEYDFYEKICKKTDLINENIDDELIVKMLICVDCLKELYMNEFKDEYKLIKDMDNYVKENLEICYSNTFHYCPNYILFDEKDDKNDLSNFKMYSVEIDNPKQIEDYGIPTCIISITENHPLHNKNRKEDEFMKEFNGVKWSISENPIEFNVIYDEGLMNA